MELHVFNEKLKKIIKIKNKTNIFVLCTLPSGHELLRDPTLENCIASLINQGSTGYDVHKSYLAILYTICTVK